MAPKIYIGQHPISWLGAALATVSAVLFLFVFFLDVLGLHTNPYLGILFFLLFPALFAVGLLLIPVGLWLQRRHPRRATESRWPRLDLNDPAQRRVTLMILVLTAVNVVIVSLASYRGVEYMDSVSFCGQVCHAVMKPEFVAHQNGPHSRVACVQCHIGPGPSGFLRAKLSGTRQVFAVLLNNHSRPIPTPVHTLSPARDTCEHCHWSEKFHGDKVKVVREYAEDESNTETVTTLRVHVGGGSKALGVATGIHWHMNVANQIEYIATDDKRQVIPWVRLTDANGHVREYAVDGVTPEQLAKGERRRMDCMDCHNRPSHTFEPTASRAVDRSMGIGALPRDLPFLKREAVAAISQTYASEDAASAAIAARLRDFYRTSHPPLYTSRRQDVDRAVLETQRVYARNVFPEMRVTFGTYPNNIGHLDFPGCFRCHDDSHKTRAGVAIRQDCDLCHSIE